MNLRFFQATVWESLKMVNSFKTVVLKTSKLNTVSITDSDTVSGRVKECSIVFHIHNYIAKVQLLIRYCQDYLQEFCGTSRINE